MSSQGVAGLGASLEPVVHHNNPTHKIGIRSVNIPGIGRVGMFFTRDRGTGKLFIPSSEVDAYMQTNLYAKHFQKNGTSKQLVGHYDLGSGNVQENFVQALAADQLGTTTNKAAPIFNTTGTRMYSGTGSTVNTYDYQLATTAGPASGATVITPGSASDNSTLQYVATITYAGSLAITEWGLFQTNVQGSQFNASTTTFTSSTITGNTWNSALSSNGSAGYIAVIGATPVGAFILSNTSGTGGVLTIPTGGYYNLTSGGGSASTPSANTAVNIYPLMMDHKTFAAINVVNGDSITFTYTLTIQSGG